MTREEIELMCHLKRVCNQIPDFALEFMSGDMPAEAEIAFARRLVDMAEQLMHHANAKRRVVIDGAATTLTIELGPPMRELG